MFKKLIYVIKYSRQKVKAPKQSLITQVQNTYTLLDSSLLADFRTKKIPLNEFIMPVTNVETLINELKTHLKVLPLHVVKAVNINNGNFRVNLETFLVTGTNYYVDVIPTINRLKELVLKLCEFLLPGENSLHGVNETNCRMLRGTMRYLLALGVALHDATFELL